MKKVGQKVFEPQDVSGWDLDNVWTDDRLSFAHGVFTQAILSRKYGRGWESSDPEFVNPGGKDAFKLKFDGRGPKVEDSDNPGMLTNVLRTDVFSEGVVSKMGLPFSPIPHIAGDAFYNNTDTKGNKGNLYSMSYIICGRTFVDQTKKGGYEILNVDHLLDRDYRDTRDYANTDPDPS